MRFLALFFGLSLIAHGLYYPQEWLVFGFILSAYSLLSSMHRRSKFIGEKSLRFSMTDSLLLGFILLTVLGLFHPVKFSDGIMEALHWGFFWLVYRLGVRISLDDTAKKNLIDYIQWLAVGIAVIGWLPWVGKVGGRLSSVFGYPNAAAAFLGAVLLLCPQKKIVTIVLFFSLLGTGSRAGVGLFLIVFGAQKLFLMLTRQRIRPRVFLGNKFERVILSRKYLKGLGVFSLVTAGIMIVLRYYRSAWDNLTTWGFASSSWQERMTYFKDGIVLAWNSGGLPQAGGWWAFPTVQDFPYWTAHPHSSFVHVLLNQGAAGIIIIGVWACFNLITAGKTWVKNTNPTMTVMEQHEAKKRIEVFSVLVFLVLHSLVDVDFSFGALGILFWLFVGSFYNPEINLRSKGLRRYRQNYLLNRIGMISFSFILLLICTGILINPNVLERTRDWNLQAVQSLEMDPDRSIELWRKSLKWDETQANVRQELAEQLLRQGNLDSGLEAVEQVICWRPFEIKVYEWAQSVVWDTAEMNRKAQPEMSMILYRWVENVPLMIESRMAGLNSLDRYLWQGHKDFLPTEHIKLLADNARQRQLTQLLPQHKL